MGKRRIKIAIDGPAASGKSTTARAVARRLGYLYIDSGAMYRVVTLAALRKGIPTTDMKRVAELAKDIDINFRHLNSELRVYLNEEDVTEDIRTARVNSEINPVAANPAVREILVQKQRKLGEKGGVVMDGRDIGTVVLPDAELKIFMVASAEERARRRFKELQERGEKISYEDVLQEIQTRDRADTSREVGPLKKATDAVKIDTTALSIPEQVELIYNLALERIKKKDC